MAFFLPLLSRFCTSLSVFQYLYFLFVLVYFLSFSVSPLLLCLSVLIFMSLCLSMYICLSMYVCLSILSALCQSSSLSIFYLLCLSFVLLSICIFVRFSMSISLYCLLVSIFSLNLLSMKFLNYRLPLLTRPSNLKIDEIL